MCFQLCGVDPLEVILGHRPSSLQREFLSAPIHSPLSGRHLGPSLSKGFKIGKVDTTLFTKKIGKDIFICQIYVDDIIFGSTNEAFCEEFGEMMSMEFEMSMIGELSFFLGLQIKQLKEGIFVLPI